MFNLFLFGNPLFFSFLLPMLTDGIITLLGQDKKYWKNYQSANEASPAYFFLAVHPILYILGTIIWFIFLYFLFLNIKEPFNLVLACTFIAGNSWGSTSWIAKILKQKGVYTPDNRTSILLYWSIVIIYFLLIGIAASYCFTIYFKK